MTDCDKRILANMGVKPTEENLKKIMKSLRKKSELLKKEVEKIYPNYNGIIRHKLIWTIKENHAK